MGHDSIGRKKKTVRGAERCGFKHNSTSQTWPTSEELNGRKTSGSEHNLQIYRYGKRKRG